MTRNVTKNVSPSGFTPRQSGTRKGVREVEEIRTIEENLCLLKSVGKELLDQLESAQAVIANMELSTDTRNEVVAQTILAFDALTKLKSRGSRLRHQMALTTATTPELL